MGLFDKKTNEEKEIQEKALKELNSYKDNNFFKYRQLLPRYGISKMGVSETIFFNNCFNKIKKEVKNDGLKINNIKGRFIELLNEKYGEPMNQYEANKKLQEEQMRPKIEKEKKLEKKFGIRFHDRIWFKCTLEEKKLTTFSNANRREVDYAYVFVENNYLEILKESVFLKSNMGNRKIYYENVASIDYDARGKLHLSNSLIINLKSSETVQLKNIEEKDVNIITSRFNSYLHQKNNQSKNENHAKVFVENKSNVDDLMKYAELYEKGLLTKEEFDSKKSEILGTSDNKSNIAKNKKFCSNCGSSVDSDSNFCSNCGSKL